MRREFYGFNEFKDILGLMDTVFNNGFTEPTQPVKYNKLISTGSFPPANITINNKTKELYIEVALVGCTEDNVKLAFDSDHLKLVVDVPQLPGDVNEISYIQRGLKKIQHIETSWFVDPRFYDRDTCKVELKNGLLTICIFPREDVRPKQVSLFGKLNTEAKPITDGNEQTE